jgi:hypothetical protein
MRKKTSPIKHASRPKRTVRKSELTPGRRWLVEKMQKIGFGRIKQLVIVNGQPLKRPPPRVYRDHRFSGGNSRRPETQIPDFILKDQVIRLFEKFDRIGDGVVSSLEVRDGLPYGMTLEEPAQA